MLLALGTAVAAAAKASSGGEPVLCGAHEPSERSRGPRLSLLVGAEAIASQSMTTEVILKHSIGFFSPISYYILICLNMF